MLDKKCYVFHTYVRNIEKSCCQKTPTLLALIVDDTLSDGGLASYGKLVGHHY